MIENVISRTQPEGSRKAGIMKSSLVLALLMAGLIPFAAAASPAPTVVVGDQVQRRTGIAQLAGTHVTVVYGYRSKARPINMRPKVPADAQFAARQRNDSERVTVISGTHLVGAGNVRTAAKNGQLQQAALRGSNATGNPPAFPQ